MGIKHGDKVDIYQPLIKFITQASGREAASQIEAPLRNFQQTRNDLLQITSSRNDSAALESIVNNAYSYISMWGYIEKNLPFGPYKGSIGVQFMWYDSYTGKKVISYSPLLERLSVIYNIALMHNQLVILAGKGRVLIIRWTRM